MGLLNQIINFIKYKSVTKVKKILTLRKRKQPTDVLAIHYLQVEFIN